MHNNLTILVAIKGFLGACTCGKMGFYKGLSRCMYLRHMQSGERWHRHWHVGIVYVRKKSSGHAGAAICSLSICKLAAVKVHISHIASKAGGLRGMLTLKVRIFEIYPAKLSAVTL